MSTAARRISSQIPLGFSSGLPRKLTAGTLTAWLASTGVSYEAIGAFALMSLVYNAKILWAPLLDRYSLPFLDRRRSWILVTQLLLAVSIAIMGAVDPRASIGGMALAALAVAFLGASQDVVIDAYRTDLLSVNERGKGAAGYVMAYRVALIVAGAAALILADTIGWRAAYWLLAVLMLACVGATLWAPPLTETSAPPSVRAAVFDPMKEFFGRKRATIALAFVLLFVFGDYVANHWVDPFLIKALEFSLTDVGTIKNLLGIGATLLGAAVGGYYVDRWGIRKALLWFGLAQALANIGYVALALVGKNYPLLVGAIGVDKFCTGLGTAAFVAYLMSLCHHKYSATQYALFTSAMSLPAHLFNAGAGFLVAPLGWAGFFGLTIVVAAPALILIRWLPDEPKAD